MKMIVIVELILVAIVSLLAGIKVGFDISQTDPIRGVIALWVFGLVSLVSIVAAHLVNTTR